MQEKVTSFDIAALAGVSQPTVSRALRGDRTVSEATRLRIEAAARQLNYKVDKRASSLRHGSTRTLALLFFQDSVADGLINPFFLSMLGSILRRCAARGYDLLTSFQQLSADWHKDYEDARRADGLILLGYGDFAIYRGRQEQLIRQGTHFVRWGASTPGGEDRTIGCDNVAGGRMAAEHLVAQGRRRIAFLGDASDHYPEFRDRYAGLCAVAGADPALLVPALTFEADGHAAVGELIARGTAFDAVFAGSDMIALGAIRALAEAGRRVPEDVAVVGFDDIPAAALANPALTTVAQDHDRAGEMLVDALIAQIEGKPMDLAPLKPKLVVRRSS